MTLEIKHGLREKPKCANPECSNKGFGMIGGKLYCGDCMIKFENRKNIIIQEMIKD